MQVLPLGFPKVMVSTIASGDMRPFIQTKDIAVFPSVTDVFGLNFIFNRILENAVSAVLAMAKAYRPIRKVSGKVIGATAFGVTTAGLMNMKKIFRGRGFHANGTGGTAMEELAELGYFDAIMDWTTHEIMDEVGGGIFAAGKNRLCIPSKMDIPYIVAPGAIDYIVKGPYQGLSRAWKKRKHIIHNRNITLVRATAAEMTQAGKFLAQKLNRAVCPVKIMIPLQGFSEPNAVDKPFFDPQADQRFLDSLRNNLKNKNVEVIKMDAHINDNSFVRKAVRIMTDMLK